MPLIRSSEQPGQTLEEFFQELSAASTNAYADVGKGMLALLDPINKIFSHTEVYGLISHARLVLLAEDDWRSDWLIVLSTLGLGEYYIEYLLPKDSSPWPNAYVRGTAQSLDELKNYLLIAAKVCKGWPSISEHDPG